MREYVLLQVLRFHRRLPEIEDALRRRAWDQIITPTAQRRPVGVLGLGNLGADGARQLAQVRSEEHTSELPSLMRTSYAVFCLKKKKKEENTTGLQSNKSHTYAE